MHNAHMHTLTIDSENEPDGVAEGLQRYNDMLETLGYTSYHHEDSTVGDGTAYYSARAEIATTGVNSNATSFEPTDRGDDSNVDDDDDGDNATMLVAQHNARRISFNVDSGAQSHNLQDNEALGLARVSDNATGFVVSPPT